MNRKPIFWVGSTKEDLSCFPDQVKKSMGYGLHLAQTGEKHPNVYRMRHSLRDVHELRETHLSVAYRAMYTVAFPEVVYALHAFEKKSTEGISTPKHHLSLVEKRLKEARNHYEDHYKKKRKK